MSCVSDVDGVVSTSGIHPNPYENVFIAPPASSCGRGRDVLKHRRDTCLLTRITAVPIAMEK